MRMLYHWVMLKWYELRFWWFMRSFRLWARRHGHSQMTEITDEEWLRVARMLMEAEQKEKGKK